MQSIWRGLAMFAVCGCASAQAPEPAPPAQAQAVVSPAEERKLFGTISKLDEHDIGFDEAELLTGDRADEAARADGTIAAGEHVDNDYYIRDPNHDLTTLPLAETVAVRLLARSGPPNYTSATETSASSLAELTRAMGGDDPDAKSLRAARYKLTVRGGKVILIEEVYFP